MKRKTGSIEVIPAVDLKGGKCVRLYQGDYSRETVFSENPVSMAERWEKLGAPRLHVVDLDGAASGQVAHWDIIADIARQVRIPVQVGGGIRDMATIERLLVAGVQRVILGTAAVEDPTLVRDACAKFGEAVIVSVDARHGYASTRGWKKPTKIKALELARRVVETGARRLICTDIVSDGTMNEPNFASVEDMLAEVPVPLIVAGGVSKVEHIVRLRDLGVEGAIVGRALYAGGMDLKKALEVSHAG